MAYRNIETGRNINTSDADLRAIINFITNGLLGSGWIQTNDTGQINPATATAATGGYQMWRMNDALAPAAPVFLKIEYQQGQTSYVYLYFTVGKASNGTGTLSGILVARNTVFYGQAITGNVCKFAFSGDANRMCLMLNYTAQGGASQVMLFGLERSKNPDKTDSDKGILCQSFSPGSTVGLYAFAPFSGAIPPTDSSGNCLIPISGSTISNTNPGIFEPKYFNFGEHVETGLNFFGYRTVDVAPESVNAVTVTETTLPEYLFTNGVNAFFALSRNSNAVAMRY